MLLRPFHRWSAWTLAVFVLHFGWEMAQANWFASMHGMTFWRATVLCFRASLGDLAITAIAFAVAAAVARSVAWPARTRALIPIVTFVAIGVAVTVAYEWFALASGRWRYDERMPTIFGIGLSPLLQWLVLPIVEVTLFRWIWRREFIPLRGS